MTIKKSVFNNVHDLETWDVLCENYLPDFDERNRLHMDIVSLTFSLLTSMHYQIMNGGIVQFIDNSTGEYFHETLEAAKRIDFLELVQVLSKVAEQFPAGRIPKNWDDRRQVWDQMGNDHMIERDGYSVEDEAWSKLWESFDHAYYSNEMKLYRLTVKYLKKNASLVDQ